jgi:flagellar protein FliL
MSDEEQEAAITEVELPRKKWNGKRLTLIAVPLLLCLGAGGFFLIKKPAHHGKMSEEAAGQSIEYVDMQDMLVNLASGNGRNRYLKLGVTLQISGSQNAKEIEKHMPRIRSAFQVYLRELRIEDLSGSGGMFLLKEELMRRINTELAPLHIDDVLFKEMLIQ